MSPPRRVQRVQNASFKPGISASKGQSVHVELGIEDTLVGTIIALFSLVLKFGSDSQDIVDSSFDRICDKLLSLYNALNDSNYDDPSALEINTLDDVIYMKMKNDVSFIVGGYMSLYEHQSTLNPNMPFRGFCYFAKMYEKYKTQNHLNMFTSTLRMIPTPQYYVFYNGKIDAPDKTLLRLSDAFMQPVKEGNFEWTAVMLNVNNGRNKELMEKCRPLHEYAILVEKVREGNADGLELEEAIDRAVNWCIHNDCMVNYLRKHREETI